jgi:alpha-tubulin suppressor-like RCC1 family protein
LLIRITVARMQALLELTKASRSSLMLGALASLALPGCGGSDPSSSYASGDERLGQVSLAITTVPSGVQCVQVTVTGPPTVTKTFSVTSGTSTIGSLSLGNVTLGSDTISGQAYTVPCASIGSNAPAWIANGQTVTIAAGVITPVTMTFRPNNPVTATSSFVGNIAQIAIGANSITVVFSDGTIEANGVDAAGLFSQHSFGILSSPTNVAQFVAGSGWDCIVLKNGVTQCAGTNSQAQLGDGTLTSRATLAPLLNPPLLGQVTAGQSHSCGLDPTGDVWCWGSNTFGQVGLTAGVQPFNPVQFNLNEVTSLAAGGFHSCAIQQGGVVCWGYNAFGQLGINSTVTTALPTTSLYNNGAPLDGMVQIVAGLYHTCALRADGLLFCWGDNNNGQIGNGTVNESPLATQVPLSGVAQVAASSNTTCARLTNGTVWCWGNDVAGACGDGNGKSNAFDWNLSPVQVVGLPLSASLWAGNSGAFCSGGVDQSLQCWGANVNFASTVGVPVNAFVPVPVQL